MPIPTPPVAGPSGGIGMFFVHSVSVETFAGSGAYGPIYAAATPVQCFLDDGVHLVRDAVGVEVVSSATVYASRDLASAFAPESRVSINGRLATVITVNVRDSGPLGLPDHVEVHLT
jgi:hypothetical protein